jgi:hypothetical protein
LNAEAREGNAEVRREKQPISTTTAQKDQNTAPNSNGLAQKTFALLRASSALSAIKIF